MKKTKEEEKVETETTDPKEEETKTDTEAEGSEEETKEESDVESEENKDSNVDIDYKAEAEKEREAREKAEKAAADSAFKLREERRKREEAEVDDFDDDLDEDEKPLTRKELDAILDKDRKEQTLSKAKEIASNISGSADEAELVMEVYRSRTFPAHLTLDQKLKEAYLIANAPKIIGQNTELKRALRGRDISSKDTAGTHHDKPKGSEPKVSNADKTVLQQVGFKWNGTSRRWEKKLNNGQTLIREKVKDKWVTRPLST
jgi:hypothetical protein|tara:strand:+ start:3653 stop:4432 length:780 start_codon:yes stop_codon:yes gene_type:complete